jgi:hypothetical protein
MQQRTYAFHTMNSSERDGSWPSADSAAGPTQHGRYHAPNVPTTPQQDAVMSQWFDFNGYSQVESGELSPTAGPTSDTNPRPSVQHLPDTEILVLLGSSSLYSSHLHDLNGPGAGGAGLVFHANHTLPSHSFNAAAPVPEQSAGVYAPQPHEAAYFHSLSSIPGFSHLAYPAARFGAIGSYVNDYSLPRLEATSLTPVQLPSSPPAFSLPQGNSIGDAMEWSNFRTGPWAVNDEPTSTRLRAPYSELSDALVSTDEQVGVDSPQAPTSLPQSANVVNRVSSNSALDLFFTRMSDIPSTVVQFRPSDLQSPTAYLAGHDDLSSRRPSNGSSTKSDIRTARPVPPAGRGSSRDIRVGSSSVTRVDRLFHPQPQRPPLPHTPMLMSRPEHHSNMETHSMMHSTGSSEFLAPPFSASFPGSLDTPALTMRSSATPASVDCIPTPITDSDLHGPHAAAPVDSSVSARRTFSCTLCENAYTKKFTLDGKYYLVSDS